MTNAFTFRAREDVSVFPGFPWTAFVQGKTLRPGEGSYNKFESGLKVLEVIHC